MMPDEPAMVLFLTATVALLWAVTKLLDI